jgi:hypothetical protein
MGRSCPTGRHPGFEDPTCRPAAPGGTDRGAMIRAMPAAKGGVEFLRSCPVLEALPPKELAALAAVGRDESYRARDDIFMEGDPAVWFCVVKTGWVRIFR